MQKVICKFIYALEPINSLGQAVHAYAARNFDVPVPQTASVDEFSRLLGGIDKMRVELKKRFDAEQRRIQFSQMLVRLWPPRRRPLVATCSAVA